MSFFKKSAFKYHFSIDDTLWIFKDITENKYASIFENRILLWAKEMHEKYDVGFSFYVWYDAWYNFNLGMSTDRFRSEFEENSHWMKFAFHGFGFGDNNKDRTYEKNDNQMVEDYYLVTNKLLDIMGETNIDRVIRVTNFSGNKTSIKRLVDSRQIKGLLCAEDAERKSYYLSSRSINRLQKKGFIYDLIVDVAFYKTSVRVESVENIDETIRQINEMKRNLQPIIVFTHEWALLEKYEEVTMTFEKLIAAIVGGDVCYLIEN